MIVDSSALVAISLREAGHGELCAKLLASTKARVSAPTALETGLVLGARSNVDAVELVTRLLHQLGVTVVAFTEAHWREALRAHAVYGKGRHPAALNFGDCMSYATAKLAARPLLAIGSDFAQTDLTLV